MASISRSQAPAWERTSALAPLRPRRSCRVRRRAHVSAGTAGPTGRVPKLELGNQGLSGHQVVWEPGYLFSRSQAPAWERTSAKLRFARRVVAAFAGAATFRPAQPALRGGFPSWSLGTRGYPGTRLFGNQLVREPDYAVEYSRRARIGTGELAPRPQPAKSLQEPETPRQPQGGDGRPPIHLMARDKREPSRSRPSPCPRPGRFATGPAARWPESASPPCATPRRA